MSGQSEQSPLSLDQTPPDGSADDGDVNIPVLALNDFSSYTNFSPSAHGVEETIHGDGFERSIQVIPFPINFTCIHRYRNNLFGEGNIQITQTNDLPRGYEWKRGNITYVNAHLSQTALDLESGIVPDSRLSLVMGMDQIGLIIINRHIIGNEVEEYTFHVINNAPSDVCDIEFNEEGTDFVIQRRPQAEGFGEPTLTDDEVYELIQTGLMTAHQLLAEANTMANFVADSEDEEISEFQG